MRVRNKIIHKELIKQVKEKCFHSLESYITSFQDILDLELDVVNTIEIITAEALEDRYDSKTVRHRITGELKSTTTFKSQH